MNITAQLKARKPGDPLPTRLQIFKFGQNDSNQGLFIVDGQTLAGLAAFQSDIGRERVPIGFEHNIDQGSPEYERTQEPRAIAGMATVEAATGKGIFLSSIDWSKTGEQSLPDYEDISPTPIYDSKTRRVIGIASVSLTRTGSVYGLTLENAAIAKLSAAAALAAPPGITGIARTLAAFERENARNNAAAESTRQARLSADPQRDTGLTGMARVLAANERANANDPAAQYRR